MNVRPYDTITWKMNPESGLFFGLTPRAEMGAPSGCGDSFDRCTAVFAGLSGPLINPMLELIGAGGIVRRAVVVDTRSLSANGLVEDSTEDTMQPPHGHRIDMMGLSERVNSCSVQRLITIDVAYPRYELLIEQQGFDLAGALAQSSELLQRNRQGIRSCWREPASDPLVAVEGAVNQPDTPESPGIAKTHFCPPAQEGEPQMGMRLNVFVLISHEKPTSHSQVND